MLISLSRTPRATVDFRGLDQAKRKAAEDFIAKQGLTKSDQAKMSRALDRSRLAPEVEVIVRHLLGDAEGAIALAGEHNITLKGAA